MVNEIFKISDEYDGHTRKLFRCECVQCGKEFWRPKHQINENPCCSKECSGLFRQVEGSRVEVSCAHCGTIFKRWKRFVDKVESGRYFCSRKCQQDAAVVYRTNCPNCNAEVIGKNRKFCSKKCSDEGEYKENIAKWKRGELEGINAAEAISSWLRRYIKEKFENKCCLCGWCEINPTTGNVPVQVDHIDGNYKNNVEENLRLLCPNCHSLTPTFGSLNKGKGREKRREKLKINYATHNVI